MKIIIKKLVLAGVTGILMFLSAFQSLQADLLELSNVPVFMSTPFKPNVLLILDNSNSMDERADSSISPDNPATPEYDGGSASPESKSEISRSVIKGLINDYQDKLNLGLMAYKQHTTGTDAVKISEIHNAFVDVSYSSADYDPNWTGALDSATHKKFQFVNPTDPTNSIYTNVVAPFYSGNNEGTSFCYSPTAHALHTVEDPFTGPWDTYRCFSSKTGSSNALPQWQNGASETLAGYLNYKYQFELFPTDSDLAKGIYDFGRFLNWSHVGKAWLSNGSPGRGYLHVPIAPVDATQKDKLDTKLGVSQFVQNKPTHANYPLQNAGLTPLEGTLRSAKDYFKKNAHADEGYNTAVCNALPESCHKNYVVLVTDGLPSVDKDGNRDNALSWVELAAAELAVENIRTYVVGFALPFGVDPSKLDDIALNGGTNKAYQADDAASLEEAMHAILSDIVEGEASATPVALTSQTVATETKAYLTTFNSSDWTGNLKSYGFSNNQLNSLADWDIKNPAIGVEPFASYTSRNIVTFKRSASIQTTQAIEFTWDELGDKQKEQIVGVDCPASPANSSCNNRGQAIINYLRGDDSDSSFRYRNNKLGDIIHSEPVYVKSPTFHYSDTLESSGEKYSTFRSDKLDRTAMLYVGANDGMLHAFEAETGIEKFAYVPSMVFDRLTRLSSPAYAHEYYVDGTPIVVDAFFSETWHTVLAGGLRAGGQGIYAIDVTNPDLDTPVLLKEKMLWEFSDHEDSDLGYSFSEPNIVRMHHGRWAAIFGNGYNNTEPDDFVSATGHAVLYVRELDGARDILGGITNQSYIKIDTGVGDVDTPNGLSSVAPVDINGDNIVDYVYAGDLRGNLWKFDFTKCTETDCTPSDTLTKWETQTPTLLFTAETIAGEYQPITVRPEVGRHRSRPGLMIYFGTGKYLETSDNTRDSQITQSFYAIWDNGSVSNLHSYNLQKREIQKETITGYRVISAATDRTKSDSTQSSDPSYSSEEDDDIIHWGDSIKGHGWYIDLKVNGNVSNKGERIINRARLKDGRIIFTSMMPTTDICDAGGEGYLMEVDAMQGSRTRQPIYDLNNDGKFNNSDKITVTINSTEQVVPVSGLKLNVGIPAPPAILGINGNDAVLVSGTSTVNANSGAGNDNSGDVQQIGRQSSQPLGRQSWRQSY